METFKKIVLFLLLGLALLLFCYFRIKPLYYQTVPYTFDQGRDFLRVEEIVVNKNLTFIGPEAGGLAGVFHGAWWYYFLTIPFILTNGNPISFSSFVFVVNLVSLGVFCYFLIKNFNSSTALIFFLFVALSPYFTGISIFAINSGMTLPFLLLFLSSSYSFLKEPRRFYLFLIFLSLGFIAESELPFGIFILPSFLITTLLLGNVRKQFLSVKYIGPAIAGLVIPFSLRILFELKNGFMQTHNLFSSLLTRSINGKIDFVGLFKQRLGLFFNYYYTQIFFEGNKALAIGIGIVALASMVIGYKKLSLIHKLYFKYICILTTVLFFLSLIYKETFYANYFEGYPYFFVLLLSVCLTISYEKSSKIKYIGMIVIAMFFGLGLFSLIKNMMGSEQPQKGGLREQLATIKALQKSIGVAESCIRIYTPPVIPYTYNYLFSYYGRQGKMRKPTDSYIKDRCWYIIEQDQYSFRIKDWRDLHIPKKAIRIKKEVLSDNVTIELWERNN